MSGQERTARLAGQVFEIAKTALRQINPAEDCRLFLVVRDNAGNFSTMTELDVDLMIGVSRRVTLSYEEAAKQLSQPRVVEQTWGGGGGMSRGVAGGSHTGGGMSANNPETVERGGSGRSG